MRNLQSTLRILQRACRSAGCSNTGLRAISMLAAAVPQAPAAFSGPTFQTSTRRDSLFTSLALAPVLACGVSSSAASGAMALMTEVAVEGDAETLLRELDSIITSDSVGAKEVSDAAVALAYLQAKGNRRLWGKIFEKVAAVKAEMDASSLANFLWAATTAGVTHFKTVAELSGPAAALLPKMSPAQVSLVVEALGAAGAKDLDFLGKVASLVASNPAAFSSAQLARVLWGFAAAGVDDAQLVQAASKGLAAKAAELSGREVAQVVWAMARLRRADKATLDTIVRSAKGKVDNVVDAAGLAWGLGFLGYKDAATGQALGSVLKAGAGQLTPAHAVDAAWGLGLVGGADKAAVDALFGVVAKALAASADCLDPYQLASLFEASALTPGAKLPDAVSAFAAKGHALVEEGGKAKSSATLAAFKAQVADATARALGARYRPEVAAAVASFPQAAADGVMVDIGVSLDANTKLAIEAVGPHYLSSAATPLGPALSRAKLLESCGFVPVHITFAEFAGAQDDKAKAKLVLAKIKAAVPGARSKVDAMSSKLDEPFDAYAD
ncbi:mitochondrial F1F0 ATP synthase associated protein [Haematococcus lacustris]